MLLSIEKCTVRKWLIIALINLLLVASAGLLMRLKMIFPMAWADQKYIMHAHSHFAFAGWVTHALMVFLLMAVFRLRSTDILPVRYQYVIAANLFASYGMLISFALQGYGLYAIIFSTLTLVVSFVFSALAWRDVGRSTLPTVLKFWFRASLFYGILSSLGTFSLVRMMVTHQLHPLAQLASVHFYLHFQYNGWFLFCCVGLFLYGLYHKHGIVPCSKKLFWMFFACVIPSYFLSVLWWKDFPDWLYVIVVVTVLLQLYVWVLFVQGIFRSFKQAGVLRSVNPTTKLLWTGVLLAVFIKISLQAASVIPSLSQLVYGYRPIVVAYLHLVLLVIISLFIIGYALQTQALKWNKTVSRWVVGLAIGVVLNEVILAVQGVCGLMTTSFPLANYLLAAAAAIILFSVCGILCNQRK